MDRINGGCFMVARKITESEIWLSKPCWWLKVWVYILRQVNHSDSKLFKRGQNYFNLEQIYNDCRLAREGINASSTQNPLKWLRNMGQIATQKTTRGIIITVLNYDKYQRIASYESHAESHAKSQTKARQKPDKSQTINKNVKNEKNDKKETADIFSGKSQEFLTAWFGFIESRKNKPRLHGIELLLKKLEKLYPGNEPVQIQCLNQSAMNGWASLFPLKDYAANGGKVSW